MTQMQQVIELAKKFTANPQYVTIDEEKIKEVAKIVKSISSSLSQNYWGAPKIPFPINAISQTPSIILYELMANSINYAYWYGKSDIRPNDSNSTKMYNILDETFASIVPPIGKLTDDYCKALVGEFIRRLSVERFPMLEQRVKHLKDLVEYNYIFQYRENPNCQALLFSNELAKYIDNQDKIVLKLDTWMTKLVEDFPGYASDMFLKRASVFFMMLYRRMGWFKNDIAQLHIPADYQIPKILNHLGVLKYSTDLECDIQNGKLIPAGSLTECEIRASTIIAAQKISEEANVSTVQIDDYLWLNRKMTDNPFHLTYTSDY